MSLFGEVTWSRAELAEVLGVTPQRIGQLVQEGVLPKPLNHAHDPKKATAAYIKHLRASKSNGEKKQQEIEKLLLDNQLKRIRLERMSGELLSREAVKQAWFAAGRQVRDRL